MTRVGEESGTSKTTEGERTRKSLIELTRKEPDPGNTSVQATHIRQERFSYGGCIVPEVVINTLPTYYKTLKSNFVVFLWGPSLSGEESGRRGTGQKVGFPTVRRGVSQVA